MSIQDLRFPDRKMVKRMIASCGLEGAVIDMDKDGYFAHSFTMPAWLAAMPERGQLAAVKTTMPLKEKKAPVRTVAGGACDRIRTWARANPDADKAAAVAAHPDLNPSTVAIQLRKVRMGLV